MRKEEALNLLHNKERLAREIPEVFSLAQCEQLGPYHLEGDVLTHTEMVVSNLPEDASEELVWAALLHDVAKPVTETRREREGETITQFFRHEVVGAEMARTITGRFGLSAEAREKVSWLVRNHMRISNLPEMRDFKAQALVNDRHFPELLDLMKADIEASQSRTEEIRKKKSELISRIEEIYRLYRQK